MSEEANALCAFTVVVDGNGVPRVVGPGHIEGLVTYREATALDIRRALLELASDYQARATAEYVAQFIPAPVLEPSTSDRVSAALARSQERD